MASKEHLLLIDSLIQAAISPACIQDPFHHVPSLAVEEVAVAATKVVCKGVMLPSFQAKSSVLVLQESVVVPMQSLRN